MLMALNSLEDVQKKPTIKTAQQIIPFLNYIATHSDAVTEYRRKEINIYIYSDASHISEAETQIRAGGYFFLGK